MACEGTSGLDDGRLSGGRNKRMSGKELIDIASEQSREWMEIWGLFVVVLMGMLGGMLTMGNLEKSTSLPS